MQFLLTEDHDVRMQVTAALSEVEGLSGISALDSLERLREEVSDADTSCVLVDEGLSSLPALSVIQELARAHPLVPIVLLARSRSAETLTAAMDAGARTVLALPLSVEEISSRLQPVLEWSRTVRASTSAPEDLMPRGLGSVVAFVGAKGGVGTSTLALMTAAQLARRGRTCIVDLDVRSGCIAAMSGITVRRSITDLVDIAAEASAREVAEVMYPLPGGLALLPAPEASEDGESLTDTAARQIISMLRYQFDYVMIDCGSRLDELLAMGLESADQVLVVATPDTPALRAVRKLEESLDRLDIGRGRSRALVLNRTSRQREIQPSSASRMSGMPLAVSVRDVTAQAENAFNSSTLLTSSVAELSKAGEELANTVVTSTNAAGSVTTRGATDATVHDGLSEPQAHQTSRRGGRARRRRSALRRKARPEKGQIMVEFPVVFALATMALLMCIQGLGFGISYMYANHAAKEAAHAYAVGKSVEEVHAVVAHDLPGVYASEMTIERSASNKVTVTLPVPSVIDAHTTASSGIVWER